jgi:hypothetical protein
MPRRLACLDRAGHLNRATKQEQLLGQGGLASIGVTDDGKGPPAVDFTGDLFGEQVFWFHGCG